MDLPTLEDIRQAEARIRGSILRTPLLQSSHLAERVGADSLLLKAECLQQTGSFKFRGASNAAARHLAERPGRGILTFSSGNHAAALARAGRERGLPVTVVMPQDAPEVKRRATEGYGARVILYDRDEQSREALGAELAEREGLDVIPPYDHSWIIAGAATCGLEISECRPDVVAVCLGGGGLLAGVALALTELDPAVRVYGVEPAAGNDGERSFQSGTLQTVSNPKTLADGAMTPSLGQRNWEIIRNRVTGIVSVTDEELFEAMWLCWTRLNLMVEPTGALALAGLLTGRVPAGPRTAVILTGGNCDPAPLIDWGRSRGLV
ncbi:MAG: pyridoxal-phosphate dependent enzyme [Fimbriimonadaceae bacterium]|nr:pyridoxal-phosphate dependent enzyme [Fimbriimonadaceae bacterium]